MSRRCGPIARRIVYTAALVPIIPASTAVATVVCYTYTTLPGFDARRTWHALIAALSVAVVVLLWRSVILWTLGRKWLTAIVSAIPFVQVMYAQSLWHTGCSPIDDMMRSAQHGVGMGLWVWCLIWVWWGWEKRTMSRDTGDAPVRGVRVTPTAQRLMASIATLPVVTGVFFLIAEALDDFTTTLNVGPPAMLLTAVVAVGVWVLIWRHAVAWSRAVVRATAIQAAVWIGVPNVATWIFDSGSSEIVNTLLVCAPIIGWGMFMVMTIHVWPVRADGPGWGGAVWIGTGDEAAADDMTPRCLRCGYMLKGLRSTRCPECGDAPTLDELWAATVGDVW